MKRGTLLGKKPTASTPIGNSPPAAAPIELPLARAKTRDGKRNITAFIDEATHRQLGMLAVTEGTTKQDLFTEALNLLFEKHSLPRIA